jgi:hypothetical protein
MRRKQSETEIPLNQRAGVGQKRMARAHQCDDDGEA